MPGQTRVKLEDLGLNRTLNVIVIDEKTIKITGKVGTGFTRRYETFKRWYEARENFPVLVDEVERIKTLGFIPNIESVWFGEVATAHFDDGSSGSIGSKVGNGWEILKIDELAIALHRNGEVISLEY